MYVRAHYFGALVTHLGEEGFRMLQRGRVITPESTDREVATNFARLVELQLIESANGTLGVADAEEHIGFPVRRIYFLTGVPDGGGRGGHAHRSLRQCLICLTGQVTIAVSKGGETLTARLVDHGMALVIDAGCWRDLYDFSLDAVVLVLASDPYDETDYIRDYDDFLRWESSASPATVPYNDLKRHPTTPGTPVHAAIETVLRSGHFIGGPTLANFEQAFAAYCEAGYAVGVGNGLDAMSLTLSAWGIGPGDEVIIPAHTFVATALAVDKVGATPVLVDVEAKTALIDPTQIEGAITSRTRAIIPVHLYGQTADIDQIRTVIGDRDIRILEDACQSHGARYKGRRSGGLGDAAAFSFYPTKNLGALGDGGALVTNDVALAFRVRQLGNYGSPKKYHHEVLGGNSRLDTLQAAVLSARLPLLDSQNMRRRTLAERYFAGLSGVQGLHLPCVAAYAETVWHVFAVRCPGRRDALKDFLDARKIGTNCHYPVPIHKQPCYAERWPSVQFPNSESWANDGLSLPLDSTHTEAEIDRVVDAVRAFFCTHHI